MHRPNAGPGHRSSRSQQRLNNQTNSVAIRSACRWRTAWYGANLGLLHDLPDLLRVVRCLLLALLLPLVLNADVIEAIQGGRQLLQQD